MLLHNHEAEDPTLCLLSNLPAAVLLRPIPSSLWNLRYTFICFATVLGVPRLYTLWVPMSFFAIVSLRWLMELIERE